MPFICEPGSLSSPLPNPVNVLNQGNVSQCTLHSSNSSALSLSAKSGFMEIVRFSCPEACFNNITEFIKKWPGRQYIAFPARCIIFSNPEYPDQF
jgi:hypothetical protein